jgi:hypothetical protein
VKFPQKIMFFLKCLIKKKKKLLQCFLTFEISVYTLIFIYLFIFYMFAQEGDERFELVTSAS